MYYELILYINQINIFYATITTRIENDHKTFITKITRADIAKYLLQELPQNITTKSLTGILYEKYHTNTKKIIAIIYYKKYHNNLLPKLLQKYLKNYTARILDKIQHKLPQNIFFLNKCCGIFWSRNVYFFMGGWTQK